MLPTRTLFVNNYIEELLCLQTLLLPCGCRHLRTLSLTPCTTKFIWGNIKCYEQKNPYFPPYIYLQVHICTYTYKYLEYLTLQFSFSEMWYMFIAVDITWRGLGSVLAQVPRRESKVYFFFFFLLFFLSFSADGDGRARPHEQNNSSDHEQWFRPRIYFL